MKKILLLFLIAVSFNVLKAQSDSELRISGNLQADMQTYTEDTKIGASEAPEKLLMNSYANILASYGKFSAGLRFESFLNPLQGFDARNNGTGIAYRFASFKTENLDITIGNFYEQFGSGLVLRSYEEKMLGYDNALDGLRIMYQPFTGVYVKGLMATQRLFFQKNETGFSRTVNQGLIRGFDAEVQLAEIFEPLANKGMQVILGGSFVSKYQKDNDPLLILPENVSTSAGRFSISFGKFLFSGEYAHKINDPSADNNNIYKTGNALLFNANFSQKGLGVLLSFKRIDNMSFRSDRNANINNLNINYIPITAKTHTYSLAAMYPYATQLNGEIAFQAEVMYKVPKGSLFGGKYGMNIALNFAKVNSLKKTPTFDRMGYEAEFFAFGEELYFQDFNVELNKKINKKLKLNLIYQNLNYNKDVIQGLAGYGTVKANVGILDMTWKIKPKHALRLELQGLMTEQDKGNWAAALAEYSVSPKWFFTIYDQYNFGNPNADHRTHYFNVAMAYIKGGNRFQLGYGKQREGIICVGGVCRNVPASNGFSFSITSSF